jgi:hypothetical protein
MEQLPIIHWRTVDELITLGFQRSRIVMMNEAHDGYKRCIRTRRVGQQLLPAAHAAGARYLAMEALNASVPELIAQINQTKQLPKQDLQQVGTYFIHPEMPIFVQTALNLGWTLISYEADILHRPEPSSHYDLLSLETTNWREEEQARNLIATIRNLPTEAKVLVWCGNHHHCKVVVPATPSEKSQVPWIPMGYQFKRLSGIDPFVIDQDITVRFSAMHYEQVQFYLDLVADTLQTFGGTAGFLSEDVPEQLLSRDSNDAYVISLDNEME